MRTVDVFKEFTLYCSHSIDAFGPDHKCARKHGHSYRVTVTVTTVVGENGISIPFDELGSICERISKRFDHTDLNTTMAPTIPTCENLAFLILALVLDLMPKSCSSCKVMIKETDSSGVVVIGAP